MGKRLMARLDVYKYDSASAPFVVDVQANILSDLNTRAFVPLMPETKARKEALPRLKPVLKIKGKKYVLMTTDIGTLKIKDLGKPVENLDQYHQEITEALDFLFQGF